jgi:hypothetical protein
VLVSDVLDNRADGETIEEILRGYPTLQADENLREDVAERHRVAGHDAPRGRVQLEPGTDFANVDAGWVYDFDRWR